MSSCTIRPPFSGALASPSPYSVSSVLGGQPGGSGGQQSVGSVAHSELSGGQSGVSGIPETWGMSTNGGDITAKVSLHIFR